MFEVNCGAHTLLALLLAITVQSYDLTGCQAHTAAGAVVLLCHCDAPLCDLIIHSLCK